MKKMIFLPALALALSLLPSCFTNPVTGRKTLNLADENDMRAQAAVEYQKFLAANRPIVGTPESDMVKRVGSRIASATQQYLQSKGQANLISGYQWEYNLVNNSEVNAWCMPGGKVVVYSGILPVTQNETGLAVVLGHEIAHAVARHSNERATDMMVTQFGGQALGSLIGSNSAAAGSVINAAVGVTQLKFSRNQESEADEMGLYLMAMAGYNPDEAVTFWQRMAAKGGNSGWAILSSHPSDQTRINDLKKYLPKARQYYRPQ